MILWILLLTVVAMFAATALFGAPYVPTHKKAISAALKMLPLKPGDLVVDLGSGDGAFLKAAANVGLRALGYEINPILVFVAWCRCFKQRKKVQIKLANFWSAELPTETKAIFMFAAGPYMNRAKQKLLSINHHDALYVVSYGFELPGMSATKHADGLYLYKLPAGKR